jgi:preprotein translocase subunit SecE
MPPIEGVLRLCRFFLWRNASGPRNKTKAPIAACGACFGLQSGPCGHNGKASPDMVGPHARREHLVPQSDETYLVETQTCLRAHPFVLIKSAADMAEQQKTQPAKAKKPSVAEFVNQVQAETSKVVWPTREETIRTAIFVFIMMVVLALFFLGVDSIFNALVKFLLTLA